jgi:transcription initiation factor TFIID subunit TAF12
MVALPLCAVRTSLRSIKASNPWLRDKIILSKCQQHIMHGRFGAADVQWEQPQKQQAQQQQQQQQHIHQMLRLGTAGGSPNALYNSSCTSACHYSTMHGLHAH